MNAIMNKTNNGKRLIAAIAIFAMLACVFAVAMPAVDAADETDGPLTFTGEATYQSYTISNDGLGNILNVEYVADDSEGAEYKGTYTLSGYINKQNYNGETGVNTTSAAQGFYAMNPAYITEMTGYESKLGECYGLYIESTSQITVGSGDQKDTEWLWYMKSNPETLEVTVAEDGKYLIDMSAVEFVDSPSTADKITINNVSFSVPKGTLHA